MLQICNGKTFSNYALHDSNILFYLAKSSGELPIISMKLLYLTCEKAATHHCNPFMTEAVMKGLKQVYQVNYFVDWSPPIDFQRFSEILSHKFGKHYSQN